MPLRLFAVTIVGLDGRVTNHKIEAVDEKIATQTAVMAAGLADVAEISVVVFDENQSLSRDIALPPWGWMITATTANGRVVEQQFLVALEDHSEALKAARAKAQPNFIVALGPRVEAHHLLRRKMKRGDVFELGLQRIGRGKSKV